MTTTQGSSTAGSADLYASEACVEMYDAAVEPSGAVFAAILDAFEPAFLNDRDLSRGQAAGAEEARQRSQFIDVGCGPGRYLLPRVPAWCKRLVAADNSEGMLKFARANRAHPLIDYQALDLLADDNVAKFVMEQGRFQRVYSFLTLHWIADQRHAMRNIATLMAPGGECFLVFSTKLKVHNVFIAMKDSPRWNKYWPLLEDKLPETSEMEDIESLRSHAADLVHAADLIPLTCEVMHIQITNTFTNETAGDFYTALNPIHDQLQEHEKEELRKFTHDVFEDMSRRGAGTAKKTLFVIHAYKPKK